MNGNQDDQGITIKSYKKGWKEMGMFSLLKRRMVRVYDSTFQIPEGNHVVKVQGLISLVQEYRAQNKN